MPTKQMRPLRAIVPAAGKGNRLKAVSGDLPKAMVQVDGQPMIDIVLRNIDFIAPADITVVVGYGKDLVMDHLGNAYAYVEQKEQLGTGHAVMVCADQFRDFDGDVLVTFGDMPLFHRDEMLDMCRRHALKGMDCTMMTAENPELKMWARVTRDEKGVFQAIVEGKDCTPEQAQIKELFSGVMVFKSRTLFEMLPLVGQNNVQHEYYLTEVPELMVRHGMKVDTYPIKDGNDLRGVNSPEDMDICARILRQREKTL